MAGTVIVPTAQGQERRIREVESLSSVAQLVFVLVPGKGPVAPFYSFLAASLLIVESQNPEATVFTPPSGSCLGWVPMLCDRG